MKENKFLEKVKSYVFNLYKTKLPNKVVYHNFEHTLQVVNASFEIGKAENISNEELENLLIAAWFHDTGYVKGYKKHENRSQEIANAYLKEQDFSEERTLAVLGLIEATKMPQNPSNLLEEIICDADLYHLGEENYKDKSKLLKAEFEILCDKKMTNVEWLQENDRFFSEHKYFTDYVSKKLNKQKTANWLKVKKDLKKAKEDELKLIKKEEELQLKKEKENIPVRGIETMWRVTLRNHIKLSDIADTKSNILLSVSAIMLSIVLTTLVPKLDKASNYYLIYPTGVFLTITVVTIIFSILATRPKVTSGNFTNDDVKKKKVNLLFFGNFHKMKLNEFEEGMTAVMNDREYLYKSLMKDLYFLGLVLQKKYKLLRVAYTVFMIGIVISVIAFVISFRLMRVETGVI